jgi:hypothetical protein
MRLPVVSQNVVSSGPPVDDVRAPGYLGGTVVATRFGVAFMNSLVNG